MKEIDGDVLEVNAKQILVRQEDGTEVWIPISDIANVEKKGEKKW